MYGFEGEVKAKYTAQMFQLFTEVFNYLPLSHCINNKVLVRVYFYFLSVEKLHFRFSGYAWWII